ncbi:MAG: signal recognition particle protein Srp54 [Candidatus Woesearchaeota archaeon]
MVLEKLSESLKNTLQKIANAVFVDERLINEIVKDIQRALLQADVNVQMVFKLSEKIKQRLLKEDIPPGLTKKEYTVKVVYEELVAFLGGGEKKIDITKKPFKIMLVGLFGNGKTTSAGKIAKYLLKRGYSVALVQTDTWRPAALQQLKQLGEKINAPVFGIEHEKNPLKVIQQFQKEYQKFDVVIFDTAGRDALSDELVAELNDISKAISADERILVIGADVGQAAEKQARAFHDSCKITGVMITKMEGTAKGGGALAACAVTQAPVKFLGVGEKIDDLEEFRPEGFVGRLLGMGDIEGLLAKAHEAMTEKEAEDLQKRLIKGEFTLIDLYEQMHAMKKMGPLSKIIEMIPGMGQIKLPKEALAVQEEKLEKWKYIMDSCTKDELEQPEIIERSRIERIAKGSGTSTGDVRELVKQYREAKKMLKMLKGGGSPRDFDKIMKRMGGMHLKY